MKKTQIVKRRNPLHDHPLLKKGGVHQKSKTSQRQKIKVALKKAQWPEQTILMKGMFCSGHCLSF